MNHETLPPPAQKIAFLRLDGDLYNSDGRTAALVSIVIAGVVYVDDYGSFSGCTRAVDEYFNGVKVHLHKVWENNGKFEAVWFRKA